jgi:hypothetical protein
MKLLKNNYFIGILFAGLLASTLPFISLFVILHHPFHVPHEFADDSLYYYNRMREVKDGYPLIGNPYFFEHRTAPAAAFFVADWIAAAPYILGIPLIATIIFDAVAGIAGFVILLWFLFKEFDFSDRSTVVGIGVALLPSYWLMIRPVSMQIVFPIFIFFLIALIRFLKESSSRKNIWLCILSLSLCFYIYTYMWQITLVTLLLLHALLLIDYKKYKVLWRIDAGTFVLSLPMFIYTYYQVRQPYYWETVSRIGLVNTRTFGSAALLNALLVTIIFIAVYVFLFKNNSNKNNYFSPLSIFIVVVGTALLGTSLSNVITQKDLETGVHIGRFVYLWFAISATILALTFYKQKIPIKNYLVFFVLGMCAVPIIVFGYGTLRQALHPPEDVGAERYARALRWLENNTQTQSVVFANDSISSYVPVMTKHYVLYHPNGQLYIMPSQEVEERYLISRFDAHLTLKNIEDDFRLYAGVGNATHQYKIYNRTVALCTFFHFSRASCGTTTTAVGYKGETYFKALYQKYIQEIQPHILDELRKFHVDYVIVDTTKDAPERMHIFETHEVYRDGAIIIFKLSS